MRLLDWFDRRRKGLEEQRKEELLQWFAKDPDQVIRYIIRLEQRCPPGMMGFL